MNKQTFDKHVEEYYPALLKRARRKYGDDGDDVLQDALLAVYRSKYYEHLPTHAKSGRVYGLLCAAADFALRTCYRKVQAERVLIDPLQWHEDGEESTIAVDPIVELQADVRAALGRLSALQYNLVFACILEERTLREVAATSGFTLYFVFTELEIAKACLRTDLDAYKDWR